jgi:hypothetical protein
MSKENTKTFRVRCELVVTTEDTAASENHIADAVSAQLWQIEQDFDVQVSTVTFVHAQEGDA